MDPTDQPIDTLIIGPETEERQIATVRRTREGRHGEVVVRALQELKAGGAQISLVQVYSAHRPPALARKGRADCGHLPLKSLSQIARRVRQATGLKAEVF